MRYDFTGKTLGCELTENEQLWLRSHQPQLFYFHPERKAYGYFSFRSIYQDEPITDKYEIAIDFAHVEYRGLPLVYEVGNRIRKTAKLYGKLLIDLHQYSDNRLCLMRPDVFIGIFAKRAFNIQYLCVIINAFLYWQSYYERYGKEPWPGESHGWKWLEQYLQ